MRLFLLLFTALTLNAQTATLRRDSPPEDTRLRAEAVALLERANRVSQPMVWPPNEMRHHFTIPNPAPGDATEGDYTSSIGVDTRRQEWRYGAFQITQIRNGRRMSFSERTAPMPAILQVLPKITPIYLGRFDHEDIIRSITAGPNGSRCIQFDTVFGDRQQAAEICVDTDAGYLLSIRQGDQITRNSNFFAFNGSFLPGHIERWIGNRELIAVDQTVVPKNDYPPDFFSVPETSTGFACQDFRRAFAVNTPQPPLQSSSPDVHDIVLSGVIGVDGHVTGLRPLDQMLPDLNDQAMKLVGTWTFTPASCNGKPAVWGNTFTVHFKGR